jgi:hypothetical protein
MAYVIPYPESPSALAAEQTAAPSQTPGMPILSFWMARALTAILDRADQIDVGTKDGICTTDEIRKAYDTGVLTGEEGEYSVGRLLMSPEIMDGLSRTPGANASTPGLVLADWQAEAAKAPLIQSATLVPSTITSYEEAANALMMQVGTAYLSFCARQEANAPR